MELQKFYDEKRRVKFKDILGELWPTLLNSIFLLIAFVFVTVMFFSLKSLDFAYLFVQCVVLLTIVVLNISLDSYAIHVRSMWHINRCTSHSDNFMGHSPCPWDSTSYPAQPITTLRSQITTRGLRDNTPVNIPCSLLVSGDIIQIDQNTPSPALVRELNSGKVLRAGEAPRVLGLSQDYNRMKSIEENEFYQCEVLETPIIKILEDSLGNFPPQTLLYRQKTRSYKIMNCILVPVLFAITFLFGLIKFLAFGDYFSEDDAIFLGPMYSIILLLSPSFQVVWNIMNTFGIVMCNNVLTSKQIGMKTCFQGFTLSFKTLFHMLKAFYTPYIYPLPEHVHSLGNLTAICAVDKEYLLTGGMPEPEKVFFFRSETRQGDQSSPTTDGATTTDDEISSGIEFNCDPAHRSSTEDTDLIGKPLYSIEITPEILGLSKNVQHATGLSFDDPNWAAHINSLKPIALNVFTTSHIPFQLPIHHDSATSFALQHYLYKTQCSCPLSYEIGVSEYASKNFTQSQLLYLIGEQNQTDYRCGDTFPRNRSNSFMQKLWNEFVQPHFMSLVIQDDSTNQLLLMSRGSADLVVTCCRDFWDGQDLQPMTETEKFAILDFFTRKTLSAYCVALAYSPVSKEEVSTLSSNTKSIGVYLPGNLQNSIQNAVTADSNANIVKMQSNQIFLGMVSLQYQPKDDITILIQNLERSGIRFIHYTAENEVRGKLFAEKLGLEAGWNCHISLSPGDEERNGESNNMEDNLEDTISTSSDSSGSSSLYYTNDSYIKAKLPKGVDKVRSHIEKVDNVPLLVPLFTDCSPDAVVEMIKIMQENGEVVLCMGNAWVRENIGILAQANIGMSFTPSLQDIGSGDCAVLGNTFARRSVYQDWPTPMEAASSLNSLTSGAYLARDAYVSLLSIVQQCRHSLGCIQRGLLCYLSLSLCVVLLYLLSALFFLPLPLSGAHIFWLALVTIPLLSLSILSIGMDVDIIYRLPDRKNVLWNKEWKYYLVYFSVVYVPMAIACLIIYWVSLNGLCESAEMFDCDAFFGNTNVTMQLGWLDENRVGHLLAQNITAMFLTLYLAISTSLFIHHSKTTVKSLKYLSWQYIAFIVITVLLQVIYFVMSQSIIAIAFPAYRSFGIQNLPFYVWLIGFVWLFVQMILQELVKFHIHKIYVETQTRLKLSFETKLGMHSPV